MTGLLLSRIIAARDDVGGARAVLDGFRRAPYVKRCAAGHCNHNEWFHIGSGINFGRQVIVPGDYRTKDFIVAEIAAEQDASKPPVCFQEMDSFEGRIWQGPGFDRYPLIGGDDGTNSITTSSEKGAAWSVDSSAPQVPYECGLMRATPTALVAGLGLSYHVPPPNEINPPTYDINRKIWRRVGGVWQLMQSNMPPLRSFAQIQWGARTILFGGADDSAYPSRVDFDGIIVSDDDFATYSIIEGTPWGPIYGMRAVRVGDWCLLVGGGTGNPVQFSNKTWMSQTPWIPSSFVPGPDLPIAAMHIILGALTINGVPTAAAIGGYNNTARPDGSPYGTIYTTDLVNPWQARTDSDFWVD